MLTRARDEQIREKYRINFQVAVKPFRPMFYWLSYLVAKELVDVVQQAMARVVLK